LNITKQKNTIFYILDITFQNPVSKKKVGSTKLRDFLEKTPFVAMSQSLRDEWVIVLRAMFRNMWQRHFEMLFMLAPEIYVTHVFVTKVNVKGRSQVRCLALSTERFYNISAPEGFPQHPGKTKWSHSLNVINKLKLSENSMSIFSPTLKKTEINYVFSSDEERDRICYEIRRLYYVITKKNLEVEKVGRSKKISKKLSLLYN